jgi:lipopolysaccharide heptosyltransferase II
MSALLIATGGGIGDALLATPVARAMREKYGDVTALVAPAHRELLGAVPDVAEVWADDRAFGGQAGRIAERRFEAAAVTWATLRSAALPFFGRVPRRAGQTRRTYSALFTDRVERRSDRGDRTSHWTDVLLDLARALGCPDVDPAPRIVVPDAARASLRAVLANAGVNGPYVVLHPTRGIAAVRAAWPHAPFESLAKALNEATGARVVVTGDAHDRAVAQRIAAAGGAVSLAGATTMLEFAALAEGARAVVAMDSGPMHVAAAVGAPTVGIYALQSDEPDRWAPRGARTAVVRPAYPCPPGHRKETCRDFACVAALESGRVVAALDELLHPQAT